MYASTKVATRGLKLGSLDQISIMIWCYYNTAGAFDLGIDLCCQYYVWKQCQILFELTDAFDKLLPLPQPPVRARTDARTNPSAQRATQLRSVLARVHAVSIQNQVTTTVP
jgi:hypothetical protein